VPVPDCLPASPLESASATHETVDAAESKNARHDAPSTVAVRSRSLTAFYWFGLSIQVLLWIVVFLAIAVAIGTGGHLTEFRYVRF
jgi:hypothetical protein